MKTRFLKICSSLLMMAIAASCEPGEDRLTLENSFTPDDIQISYTQTGNKGNGITLQLDSEGVMGYWDYGVGVKYTDKVEFVYPVPGTSTFTFHVTNQYMGEGPGDVQSEIVKTVDITIEELDQPLPAAYYSLVGEELEGKTWVFAGENGDKELWWFMCGNGNIKNCMGVWWNAGGTGAAPCDATNSEMTFDLDGAANLSNTVDGVTTTGGFALSGDGSTLTTSGDASILAPMPQFNEGVRSPITKYEIAQLSADKMVLYVSDLSVWGRNNGPCGWTWVFVPKH